MIFENTAFNTKEFKGTDFIRKLMYKKTLFSDPAEYSNEVLEGLVKGKVIDSYELNGEDVNLINKGESEKVEYKPALKAVYKLMANSIYGKTG